ncbi:MAG: protein tyrosine phosphatase [Herbaspirillum sp.]
MKKVLAAVITSCLLPLLGFSAHASEPTKIAFVCTGNTGRSLTAEMLARNLIAKKKLPIAVISRAVDMDPYDTKPEPNAAILLSQRGLDVSSHQATPLTPNDIRHSDLILTMTVRQKSKVIELYPEAKAKIFTISEYAAGEVKDVEDAWGKPMENYEKMIKQMDQYVALVLEKAPNPK